MNNYQILYSYFSSGGGELVLPNVSVEPIPYHNFLLLLEGHTFPILCSYLLPVEQSENCWETHISELEKRYRGRGYGKMLYQNMINFGQVNKLKIVSSKYTSKSVTKIWESLMREKRNNIYFANGRYVVKDY